MASAALIQALNTNSKSLKIMKHGRISGEVVVRFDTFRTMDPVKQMLVSVTIPQISLAHTKAIDILSVDGVTREALLKHSNLPILISQKKVRIVNG